jgi:hypothetical protein
MRAALLAAALSLAEVGDAAAAVGGVDAIGEAAACVLT